jgi:methionyl-tRNA formyltransferase
VTLQTLHPTKMDHGKILLQWPSTGFEIPRPESIRPPELTELLAPLGSIMLVHAIRNNLHVPPIHDLTPQLNTEQEARLRKAPKIVPDDCRIRWSEWTASEILRRHRVIGPLWNHVNVGGDQVRVTFSDGFSLLESQAPNSSVPPGLPMLSIEGTGSHSALWCKTVDGKILSLSRLKVPGYGEQAATTWARKSQLFNLERSDEVSLGEQGDLVLASSGFE